jgi:hypothetical protein
MFAIIRPGYDRHEYILLCKNTIQIKKYRAYQGNRRWLESDIECNMIEYIPLTGRRKPDLLFIELSQNSQKNSSVVGWKNGKSQATDRTYYDILPLVLNYDNENYQVIAFQTTIWLPSRTGEIYKLCLSDDEKSYISLQLNILNPGWYGRSEQTEMNEDVREDTKEDVKKNDLISNIIHKVPLFVIENHINSEIMRSDCPILGQSLKECEKVSMLDCYHVFDSVSIDRWMNMKANCPICKNKSKIIHTISVSKSSSLSSHIPVEAVSEKSIKIKKPVVKSF